MIDWNLKICFMFFLIDFYQCNNNNSCNSSELRFDDSHVVEEDKVDFLKKRILPDNSFLLKQITK